MARTRSVTRRRAADNSMGFAAWVARNGTSQFQIDLNETFTGIGTTPTLDHSAFDNAFGGSEWVFGRTKLSTGDSPTGTFDLGHDALPSDSQQYSASFVIEGTGTSVNDVKYSGTGRGVMVGVGRGIG